MAETIATDFLEELRWRGMLHQTTGDAEVEAHLVEKPQVGYCGFDPTADSLTIGNLLQIILLGRFQRAGHHPIAVMGGGTGLIGDPSGKSAERPLLDAEQIRHNISRIRQEFERVLDFSPQRENRATIVDNLDWLGKIPYIEMLRDYGKHFSVNVMIAKDSVSARLNEREQGISYTEFSYQVLQAYDFLHLYRTAGCTIQIGGSDQYGNIVAGIDLIRRLERHDDGEGGTVGADSYGITTPLVTRADGGKIGKSERGAIWLNADRTSPYQFHQFWLNVSDADVVNFLKWYTFLDREAITALEQSATDRPQEREAQHVLAEEMTRMIHGDSALDSAKAAGQALFSGEVRSLDPDALAAVAGDLETIEISRERLGGEAIMLGEILVSSGLAQSNREVREFLSGGAVRVNGEQVRDNRPMDANDLMHDRFTLLKRGKKLWRAIHWT
ncbi:MAG: tyrosine--tRNA ligase [Phycisphaerales bacterium]|nr:tyrosine--tRNA ligase [Phycisphaerales bacterium]